MTPDDLRLNNYAGPIVFYLYSPDGSRNAISADYRRFSPPPLI